MDTDVVVAAMRSNTGASFALIGQARAGKITLAATVPLCVEYESVCKRPEHEAAAGLSRLEVDLFLDAVIDLVEPTEVFSCGGHSYAIQGTNLYLKRRSAPGSTQS